MRRRVLVLAVAVALVSAVQTKAMSIALLTSGQQAIQAEVIVVGKVTEVEKDLSLATPHANTKDKIAYRIGVVQIAESIRGAKGLTTIRVGWQPIPVANPIPTLNLPPGVRIGVIGGGPFHATLNEGQEGCLFLEKHHEGDFYVMLMGGHPLDKKAVDFDKNLASVKKIVKFYEDPTPGLKAKEAADRHLAVALLVQKYRSFNGKGQSKQEDIDVGQSKLLLQIMSEMEWDKFEQKDGIPVGVNRIFGMLGIQPGQHGFDPPKFQANNQANFSKVYGQYVMKWIKENGDKYRIQRYVAAQ